MTSNASPEAAAPQGHRRPKKPLGLLKQSDLLVALLTDGDYKTLLKKMKSTEVRAARDFLIDQVISCSEKNDAPVPTREAIQKGFEPIPNYFYKQDCREPLESCFNETCLTSNPGCFSKKVQAQIDVVVRQLQPLLKGEKPA